MSKEASDERGLIVEVADGIASVVINREHRRNAMDEPTVRRFLAFLSELRRQELSCVVVTGAGTKAFSAGDDLKALAEKRPAPEPSTTTYWLELTDRLEELPVPVIAAIEGYCMGGGLELALACDLRIAGSGATLALPEIAVNALPTGGGTFRLSRVVGLGRAREMVQFGRRVSAAEAVSWGLVSEVVPEGAAFERARQIARDLREIPLHTLVRAKALVTFSYAVPSPTARYLAYLADSLQMSSEEFRSGISDFVSR